eukprot:TRINITY_DN20438_c0_g1_i1.p1 TRINITY_DN20438_c0_g1~~TRINITY_DN20438_c0_g1_i1.p1  ORF type:complete len:610 (+),score=86.12 TRINITY_DN20438_c0_g1_i1:59-1888(+)
MAWSGVVVELQANGWGVIARDDPHSANVVSIGMHVKRLLNGGEDDLRPGVPVRFDIQDGAATNIRIPGIRMFSGIVQDFNVSEKAGHILPCDDDRLIAFTLDDIFRILPPRIIPGIEVTYNILADRAANIRFPTLDTNFGTVREYFDDKLFGFIKPRDGRGRRVYFNLKGVINASDVPQLQGAQVTFDYERVPSFRRARLIGSGRGNEKQVRATNIRIQHPGLGIIEEVQHVDAAVTQSEAAARTQEPHAINMHSIVSSEGYVASDAASSTTEAEHAALLGASSCSDEISLSRSVMSAPALSYLKHCFPTNTLVMTQRGGQVEVTDVRIGDKLKSLSDAKVHNVLTLQSRERLFVDLTLQDYQGSLMVTSNHMLPALRPGKDRQDNRVQPLLAYDLQKGDLLRTLEGVLVVEHVDHKTVSAPVVEIELDDPRSTLFVSNGGNFVEVYGASSPRLRGDAEVKILTFRRHDRFKEALLQSEELQAVRRALESAGLDANLETHGLGLGKMLVPPHLAWPTLLALYTRSREQQATAHRVGIHEVVVSRETEGAVREAIQAHAGNRARFAVSEQILPLSSVRLARSGSRAAATYSTNPDANPRVRRPCRWDSDC